MLSRLTFRQTTLQTLTLLLLLSCATAQADDQAKLAFLQQQFDNSSDHSRLWQQGWLGLFGGVAALNGIAYTQTEGEHNKYDRAVGFTTSFLGAADMLLNPMKTHRFADDLKAMPEPDDSTRQAKLARAEQWLNAAAEREAYEQSLLNHVLAGLVNGLAGLAVAYDDKRPADGWMTFASGMIASEVKIYTAPQTMTAAREQYRNGNLEAVTAKSDAPYWQVAAFGPVLSATYHF
ncbi:hypothetical protein [Thalassolituus hydrocarboniclasticus]|uniref:DUF2264 domain-containing protein n=1 Tax=Thalassolituus hydrocarboniclasticus TaxID=2742796 RepID=A0ABY6A7J2_9GAMM|nr:hypothetical protein [Thalassolituus hydrocarboniclasticus]UXD86598.1 hypothetical protein HUF19_03670 [Thalassolituus hydrocarboniclasticus]